MHHVPKRFVCLLGLLLLSSAGCGRGPFPVSGKVTFEDGTPLKGGFVNFITQVDKDEVVSRGAINMDGTYNLTMRSPHDGALAGTHKVYLSPLIVSDPTLRAQMAFDDRFLKPETSGLTCEVRSGVNVFDIKVTRPANAGR